MTSSDRSNAQPQLLWMLRILPSPSRDRYLTKQFRYNKQLTKQPLPYFYIEMSFQLTTDKSKDRDFICPVTGRHLLDALYETFAKPQVQLGKIKPDEPSIYIRHSEGQVVAGGYKIDKIFEDALTGFYAEGRIPLSGKNPPVLVIRGYGSWYPFEQVLQDTPEVFIARLDWQLKSAEKRGAIDWLMQSDRLVKPDIIGDSLGGKIAQQIAAKYPDCFRSTVTYNALGVSNQIAETSKAENVFHYFTLGERYAFWANGGDYIPGRFFQISKNGQSFRYKIEEAIVRMSLAEKKAVNVKRRKPQAGLVPCVLAQLILLKRHNDLILNKPGAVVVQIDRTLLNEFIKNRRLAER